MSHLNNKLLLDNVISQLYKAIISTYWRVYKSGNLLKHCSCNILIRRKERGFTWSSKANLKAFESNFTTSLDYQAFIKRKAINNWKTIKLCFVQWSIRLSANKSTNLQAKKNICKQIVKIWKEKWIFLENVHAFGV